MTQIFKWSWNFFPRLSVLTEVIFFCVFATVFGVPCWPKQYYTGFFFFPFPRWPPFWKPNALSMFVQSQCFILVMYQSKTDFTANETHFFSLPLRSLANPSPLSPSWGSWRISPAQPSDQCCASEVYRRACNAFSSSNNLRDSTLLCDAEATTLGLSCHCAGELWRHALIFPDNSAANVGAGTHPKVTGITEIQLIAHSKG